MQVLVNKEYLFLIYSHIPYLFPHHIGTGPVKDYGGISTLLY